MVLSLLVSEIIFVTVISFSVATRCFMFFISISVNRNVAYMFSLAGLLKNISEDLSQTT